MKSSKAHVTKLLLAPVIALLVIGMQSSPALAQSYPQFQTTASPYLTVRSGPYTTSPSVAPFQLYPGTWFGLVCQTQNGTSVGGNRTWDRIAINGDATRVMYISDYYTTTPSFNSSVKAWQTPGYPDTPDCSRV